jgi:hypothetical protein
VEYLSVYKSASLTLQVGVFVAGNILEKIVYGRKKTYVSQGILLAGSDTSKEHLSKSSARKGVYFFPFTVCLIVRKSERLSYNTGDWYG